MSRIRSSIFVVCAVLLVVASVPAPEAGYAKEDSFRYFPVIQDQTFFDGEFHPSGDAAQLIGGSFGRSPSPDDQYMIRYDGTSWDIVYKKTSTPEGPLMDIDWRPQGDYALIPAAGGTDSRGEFRGSIKACVEPCTSADNVTELWRPALSPGGADQHGGFAGRMVDWHPSGDYAIVTGSGLIRWNGSAFQTVATGEETLYSAIDWHPSGEYALVQKGLNKLQVCVDPCRTAADLAQRPVPYSFGQSNASKAIEEIRFHPDGEKAHVVGLDNKTSQLLELNITDPTRPDQWERTYYNPQATTDDGQRFDKFGEITDIAWYPNGTKSVVTSSLRMQVTSFPYEPDGPHDFTRLLDLDGPKLNSAVMEPNGNYTLMGARDGFYRYDPLGIPTVDVQTPAPGEDHSFFRPFTADGQAEEKRDGKNITNLEWTLVDRAGRFGTLDEDDWTNVSDENWTRADDGTVNWSFEVDPSSIQPGKYILGVRADDGDVVGAPGVTTFRVPGPEVAFETPANETEVDGVVPVEGNATPRAPDGEVTAVQWRVSATDSPLEDDFGVWHEANVSDAGDTARWSFDWDTRKHDPCYKTIEVRAKEGNITGLSSYQVAYIPGCLDDGPEITVEEVDNRNKTVSLNWTDARTATGYTLKAGEDSRLTEAETLAVLDGDQSSFVHEAGSNGQYHYWVKASNQYEESTFGPRAVATVEDPSTSDDGSGDGSSGDDGSDDGSSSDDGSGNDIIGQDPGSTDGSDDGSGSTSDGGDGGTGSGAGTGAQDVPGFGLVASLAALAAAVLARSRRRR